MPLDQALPAAATFGLQLIGPFHSSIIGSTEIQFPVSHTHKHLPAKGALLISGNWSCFLKLTPTLQMRALRLQGVEKSARVRPQRKIQTRGGERIGSRWVCSSVAQTPPRRWQGSKRIRHGVLGLQQAGPGGWDPTRNADEGSCSSPVASIGFSHGNLMAFVIETCSNLNTLLTKDIQPGSGWGPQVHREVRLTWSHPGLGAPGGAFWGRCQVLAWILRGRKRERYRL